MPSTWSPSTSRPVPSTAMHRSASPSSAKPTSAPCSRTAAISDSGWVAPQSRLMLSPSGSSWMTVTRAPVARRISGPTRYAAPFAVSSTTWSPPASTAPARPGPVRRGTARAGLRRPRSARSPSAARPGSSSARRISASSSSSRSSSSFRPLGSSTLRPLSSAGLCDAETMIPAANPPPPARNARAGVGTTPTAWTSTPMLVAPAVIAATNMSPDRRVSWPTTSAPLPPIWWAVARPSANASDGRRSTLAAPRMPSVPNRRVMQGPRAVGAGRTGRIRVGQGAASDGAASVGVASLGSGSGVGVGTGVGVGRGSPSP